MRSIALTAVTAALAGGVLLGAPAGAQPVLGGCFGDNQLSQNYVPGTGSGGQDTEVTATLSSCSSPLLPGIAGGVLTLSYPTAFGAPQPASGGIAWSNGRYSAISGIWDLAHDSTSTMAISGGLVQVITC